MNVNRKSVLTGMFLGIVLFGMLITPALADNRLNVPLYGQRWYGDATIGDTSSTIADYGCAITSIAMILGYYGMGKDDSNPLKVNEWLTEHDGYDYDLVNSNGWNESIREMSGDKVQWQEKVTSGKINRLNQEIDNGYPVIIEIPYGAGSHFMVVTGRRGTTYYLNDPLVKKKTMTASDAITSLRIYRGPIPTRIHPTGTLINSTSDKIYKVENNQKRFIPTINVFKSWNFKEDHIITLSNKEMDQYPEGRQIVFRDGTLTGDEATGDRYVIEHSKKRSVADNAFIQLGYDPANIIWLTNQDELNLCPDGEPIVWQDGTIWHVSGTLINSSSSSDIYEVLGEQGQLKRLIPTAKVFNARFGDWNRIVTVTDLQLDQYEPFPELFGFPDGALILYGSDLYVIAENEKRYIADEETRDIIGYTWPPIPVSDEEFNLHQQGEDITKENSVKYRHIYVPGHYSTIQAAVDSAFEGDTIIVKSGIYNENIVIDTDRLTIESMNGADFAVVQAADVGSAFEIIADYVNISGFTVTGATGNTGAPNTFPSAGIHLMYSDYCNISNNNASSNGNLNDGIFIGYSSNNLIINNNADNNRFGITVDGNSSNNTILNNDCFSNRVGILAFYLDGGVISNNNCSNNVLGIRSRYLNDSSVFNNICYSNAYHGISLLYSNNNSISNNICSNIYDGIVFGWSSNNKIMNNSISSSSRYGIGFRDSSDNVICLNNFINNTDNVYYVDSANIWNSPEKITYAYNGNTYENYLGNYWDDYTDIDSNSDGIWDNPYSIDSDKDYYPLVESFDKYGKEGFSSMEIKAFCPVNLSVSDPDGLIINPETNEIQGASYAEEDINGDGDLDDIILVPNRKTGSYEITVIPEPDAESTNTYTLEVSTNDTTIILAEGVLISDIPQISYEIESNETGITDKTLVDPEGGIGIAVLPRISHITSGSTVNFTVKIVSTENFDDVFHLYLDNESLPAGWRADIEWFNKTSAYVEIPSRGEAEIALSVEIPANVSGTKAFRAIAKSTRWTPVVYDTGILYIS